MTERMGSGLLKRPQGSIPHSQLALLLRNDCFQTRKVSFNQFKHDFSICGSILLAWLCASSSFIPFMQFTINIKYFINFIIYLYSSLWQTNLFCQSFSSKYVGIMCAFEFYREKKKQQQNYFRNLQSRF